MSRQLLDDLRQAAERIRQVESEARTAIDGGDEARYRQLYAEKVNILLGLPDLVEPQLADLPEPLADRLAHEVEGFAARAGSAKSLNSIFYMYALLYPDDYREGDPNDLERFIDRLESRIK
ncbi:hypothetical protein [Desulfocurvibacter africanus]|uniref:Uncharacterized protein n=1 Tax=Desulfocurvibacter africanus subsp. africanus str. Walvis Bay TaxID=690850 RepID=F3Z180_DESAF|nr:hypothetical protein [Desulfocurvibacter africanus]EGJ49978.1 hypothetical protein Desaf_1642 [Desulfocurvibacter africanus subsp. africanus str. Walvis Bay]